MTAPNEPTPLSIPFPTPLSRTLLVVDDEPAIRMIAQITLRSAGFYVVEAGDIASALEAIKTAASPFNAVMLDLGLPDGDGSTAIPLIRQSLPHARILVVSGHVEMDPSEIGADAFLAKPFNKTTLLIAINSALSKSHAESAQPPNK